MPRSIHGVTAEILVGASAAPAGRSGTARRHLVIGFSDRATDHASCRRAARPCGAIFIPVASVIWLWNYQPMTDGRCWNRSSSFGDSRRRFSRSTNGTDPVVATSRYRPGGRRGRCHGHCLGGRLRGTAAPNAGTAPESFAARDPRRRNVRDRIGAVPGANDPIPLGVDCHWIVGTTRMVCSHLNPAVGAGLSSRQLDQNCVSLLISGDGATNRGEFHTALHFAAVFDLPVVFVIENNGWEGYVSGAAGRSRKCITSTVRGPCVPTRR